MVFSIRCDFSTMSLKSLHKCYAALTHILFVFVLHVMRYTRFELLHVIFFFVQNILPVTLHLPCQNTHLLMSHFGLLVGNRCISFKQCICFSLGWVLARVVRDALLGFIVIGLSIKLSADVLQDGV